MKQANKDEIRQRYLAVDTSNVADILDTLGYLDQGLSSDFAPLPVRRDGTKLAGWAYTIRGQMTPFPLGGDDDKVQACQGLSAGEISVWSGDGKGICYFGELIARGMKERGCVGAVLDGGIRDVRWIGQHGFPVFAKYRTPVQSIGRWKVNAWQVPVVLRGATPNFVSVKPGDFILGEDDGAIVIPAPPVEQVLAESERLTATEAAIRTQLSEGLTLAQALAKYGHV